MKKAYKHPATEVTSLELTDMILSGSGTPTPPSVIYLSITSAPMTSGK